jgi:hypothetical protein
MLLMAILIEDGSGGIWALGVDDNGEFTVAPASGSPTTLFLNDDAGESWQVVPIPLSPTSAEVDAISVASSSYPLSVTLTSPGGFPYALSIITTTAGPGILDTALVFPTPAPASPKVAFTGTAYLVPLQATPQTLTITMNGVEYDVTVFWCWPADCWMMNIADSNGNPILSGIPIVTGCDLLAQFEYLGFDGQLIAETDNDTDAVPTFNNLGTQGNLFFVVQP